MTQTPILFEAKEKTAVFTYGRNNPPTVGHEKLFDKTSEVAKEHGVKPHIFTSHSTDNTRNPLTPEHKVKLIKHAYPNAHVAASSKEMPSVIQIAKHLHNQGHQHLVMVAGSDRVDEYQKLLHKYNGHPDHYNFKSIKVVSAGHRDPDSPGAAGMSGTKLRSHAAAGNKQAFKSGLMSKLSDEHKEDVYNKVRESMSKKEEYEYEWGTPEGTAHMKKITPGESTEVRQDPDISKRAGTQPAKYHAGLSKETKVARDRQFKKQTKMDSRDPNAYKPAPGDTAKTNPSVYTMRYKKMYGEEKVAALFKPFIKEESEDPYFQEISFDGIQTKNFDFCIKAYNQFNKDIADFDKLTLQSDVAQTPQVSDTVRRMRFKTFLDI